jgi:hypothetical protein
MKASRNSVPKNLLCNVDFLLTSSLKKYAKITAIGGNAIRKYRGPHCPPPSLGKIRTEKVRKNTIDNDVAKRGLFLNLLRISGIETKKTKTTGKVLKRFRYMEVNRSR